MPRTPLFLRLQALLLVYPPHSALAVCGLPCATYSRCVVIDNSSSEPGITVAHKHTEDSAAAVTFVGIVLRTASSASSVQISALGSVQISA